MDNGAPSVETILTKQPQMSSVGCWVMAWGLREGDGTMARTGDKLHKYSTNTKLTAKCLRSCIMSHRNGLPTKITGRLSTHGLEGFLNYANIALFQPTPSHATSTTHTPIDKEWFVRCCSFFFFFFNSLRPSDAYMRQ